MTIVLVNLYTKLEISFMQQQQESIDTYIQALEMYNTALRFAPNDFKTNKRKAMALEKLCELQLEQQHYIQASDSLSCAIAAFEIAFSQTPNDVVNISYLGMVVERLAELQSSNKQYAEAHLTYQKAIAIYDSTLKLAPKDYCNHALKAGALTSLANLQFLLLQHIQAVDNYQQAVDCYDISLSLNPFKATEFDKARTLQKLGNCLRQLSRNQEALDCYQAAKQVFSQLPPGDKHVRFLDEQIQKLKQQD